MDGKMKIKWIDFKREPQCQPDPAFPHGIDVNVSLAGRSCETPLPYPAKRCGVYIIECQTCGARVGCTTAGRPDDPRSIKIACCASQTEKAND